ncbi:unnamed protein product [Adineta steineri]|uniref:Uncharacterized protein n=1 Tax=Adineta steineri TaxID=433720 RepID=A0A819DZD0_9BILA|nr:unnamed protein product [Adineta steineri]CAF0724438.1 unnamed protein product [Adineta steineri]CAF0734311.1 unnamed protein product [Adineta steineri]CAF3477168.1 unnamed protein product [Adineta steineri]CAF3841853.1 unnamed protein product [Adineta steineri]
MTQTISFGSCVADYWFVWMIDGASLVFTLAINLAISYFFLKYFQFLAHGGPSPPKATSQFGNYDAAQAAPSMPVGAWGNAAATGTVFNAV